MASSIESYLGQLRSKLEARFDSECADQLLSEIRSHLVDSAAELEDEGVDREEAERLSVARFGAPEKAAFLLPLGKQFGTGDRYWGRGAFWVSVLAALGLIWYGVDPTANEWLSPSQIPPILALVLVLYGYAVWKAKSFSMIRQSSIVVALMLLTTGIFQRQVVDPAFGESAGGRLEGLQAFRGTPNVPQASLSLTLDSGYRATSGGVQTTDLPSVPRMMLASDTSAAPPIERASVEPSPAAPVYGMAPASANPWDLTGSSLFPEVSQMLLTWLYFLLTVNAAVCWVGCIEHEQKSGVLLVQ